LEEIQGQLQLLWNPGHTLADCNRCKATAKNDRKGAKPADKRGDDNERKKCFKCKEKGHISKVCPNKKKNWQMNSSLECLSMKMKTSMNEEH